MAALLRRLKEWTRPDEQTKIMIAKAVDEERKCLNRQWEKKMYSVQSEASESINVVKQFYALTSIQMREKTVGHVASEYLRGKRAMSMKSALAQSAKLMHECAAEAQKAAREFEEASKCAAQLTQHEELIHGMGI